MRLTDKPKTLAEMKPDVEWPAELQAVMDKALAVNANDRYQKSAEFGRDIAKAVESMPADVSGGEHGCDGRGDVGDSEDTDGGEWRRGDRSRHARAALDPGTDNEASDDDHRRDAARGRGDRRRGDHQGHGPLRDVSRGRSGPRRTLVGRLGAGRFKARPVAGGAGAWRAGAVVGARQDDEGRTEQGARDASQPISSAQPAAAVEDAAATISRWQSVFEDTDHPAGELQGRQAIAALNPLIEKLSGQNRSNAVYVEMLAYGAMDSDELFAGRTQEVLNSDANTNHLKTAAMLQQGRELQVTAARANRSSAPVTQVTFRSSRP